MKLAAVNGAVERVKGAVARVAKQAKVAAVTGAAIASTFVPGVDAQAQDATSKSGTNTVAKLHETKKTTAAIPAAVGDFSKLAGLHADVHAHNFSPADGKLSFIFKIKQGDSQFSAGEQLPSVAPSQVSPDLAYALTQGLALTNYPALEQEFGHIAARSFNDALKQAGSTNRAGMLQRTTPLTTP